MSHNPKLCDLCHNTGLVRIWHPYVVYAIRHNCETIKDEHGHKRHMKAGDKYKPLTCEVPCACKCGDNTCVRTTRSGTIELTRFNRIQHVPKQSRTPEADVKPIDTVDMPNYTPEFEGW